MPEHLSGCMSVLQPEPETNNILIAFSQNLTSSQLVDNIPYQQQAGINVGHQYNAGLTCKFGLSSTVNQPFDQLYRSIQIFQFLVGYIPTILKSALALCCGGFNSLI